MMVVRTYPIRVGGNSGPGYGDQYEIEWADIGVEPEITTVTKKERRVFTWSDAQYRQALVANQPDIVFLNFCNYLSPDWASGNDSAARMFAHNKVLKPYWDTLHKQPLILLGYGPKNENIQVFDGVPF
jgi:hypothetical protein